MMEYKLMDVMNRLPFKPIFFILDKGLCRVMLVEREDKYEYSGIWAENRKIINDTYYGGDTYKANIGKSHLEEYISNYELTKDSKEVVAFLEGMAYKIPLTTEQMQNLNSNPDFKY